MITKQTHVQWGEMVILCEFEARAEPELTVWIMVEILSGPGKEQFVHQPVKDKQVQILPATIPIQYKELREVLFWLNREGMALVAPTLREAEVMALNAARNQRLHELDRITTLLAERGA